jgi:DNA-binding MarR family transcriptional regulator
MVPESVKPDAAPQGPADPLQGRDQVLRAVVQHLRVIFRSIQEHSRWVEKQCGVSAAQLWAMWELFAEPGMPVSRLSKALSVHQSTASNMLDKLEKKALVRRDRSGPDQRVVRLFLTPQGVALLAEAPRPAQGALTDALQQLPDQTVRDLENGLGLLLTAMRVKDEKAAMHPLSEP